MSEHLREAGWRQTQTPGATARKGCLPRQIAGTYTEPTHAEVGRAARYRPVPQWLQCQRTTPSVVCGDPRAARNHPMASEPRREYIVALKGLPKLDESLNNALAKRGGWFSGVIDLQFVSSAVGIVDSTSTLLSLSELCYRMGQINASFR